MQPSAPAAAAWKAGARDSGSLSVRVESAGATDRLVLSLGPQLLRRLGGTAGFRTQASDVSQLTSLRVSVSGPGIANPIQSAQIAIGGVVNSVAIPAVPAGHNRVITAQFYNALNQPVANAVAMGVYSSGSSSVLTIDVRRRFLVLGRVLASLLSARSPLADSLDTSALQAKIDQLLYGSPTPGPFVVDPVLVDSNLIVSNLNAASGHVASLDLSQPAYVFATSTLTLPVSGLLGSDTLSVRVDDPTSDSVTQANGTITISGIAPGTWPVYVRLNSNVGFSYPDSTLGSTLLPPTLPADALLLPAQNFSAGQTVNQASYTLKPAAPQLDTDGGIWIRSGQTLTLDGSGFYPEAGTAANKVRFAKTGANGAPIERIVGVPSDGSSLSFSIPAAGNAANQLPEAGAYTVSSVVGGSDISVLGTVVVNVWAVKSDGATFAANGANGLGWDRAIKLEDALLQTGASDEIWLQQGQYYPPGGAVTSSYVVSQAASL
ncbi:MAG TPA: hypothetical protein V6D23_28455, partial [Candidatus Obscuribacterales bacterium]